MKTKYIGQKQITKNLKHFSYSVSIDLKKLLLRFSIFNISKGLVHQSWFRNDGLSITYDNFTDGYGITMIIREKYGLGEIGFKGESSTEFDCRGKLSENALLRAFDEIQAALDEFDDTAQVLKLV